MIDWWLAIHDEWVTHDNMEEAKTRDEKTIRSTRETETKEIYEEGEKNNKRNEEDTEKQDSKKGSNVRE